MSRALRDLVIVPAKADAGYLKRTFGFRRCYRRPSSFHGVENLACDCLRVELPLDAQAKSSGALGTPDRNHDCHYCLGTGENHTFGVNPCPRCAGTGELRADRSPLGSPPGEFRRIVDGALRTLKLGAR